ncbi:MAG TPA: fluoride efflux transporter CrcB [Acidimicrobiales bacterium]|nr:fluoride efflux transporter CrcB [Acidimicrobiales bacterium]
MAPFDDELPIDPDLAPDDPGEPHVGPRAAPLPPPRVRRTRPDVMAAIALGGAIGTTLRAALGELFPTPSPQFPATTLAVNLIGSFVLGVILVLLVERFGPAPRLRPFLATGILGGFTTFSTFTVESVQLVRHDRAGAAVIYVAVSLVGGVVASLVGIAAGHAVVAAPTSDPTPGGRTGVDQAAVDHTVSDAIEEARGTR